MIRIITKTSSKIKKNRRKVIVRTNQKRNSKKSTNSKNQISIISINSQIKVIQTSQKSLNKILIKMQSLKNS